MCSIKDLPRAFYILYTQPVSKLQSCILYYKIIIAEDMIKIITQYYQYLGSDGC